MKSPCKIPGTHSYGKDVAVILILPPIKFKMMLIWHLDCHFFQKITFASTVKCSISVKKLCFKLLPVVWQSAHLLKHIPPKIWHLDIQDYQL